MTTGDQPLLFPNYPLPRVRAIPIREQPGYRVEMNPEACNLLELLSVLISGKQQIEKAEVLIERFGSVHHLAHAQVEEIAHIQGIGRLTALRIKAAMILGKKVFEHEEIQPAISCPDDAYQILRPRLAHLMHEVLSVMVLNTKSKVVRIDDLYRGTVNASPVRCAEVFRSAVQLNGVGIIVAHNHPSGDPTPSKDDIHLTKSLFTSGKVLDVELMDHLVIGNGKFVSMKQERMGF